MEVNLAFRRKVRRASKGLWILWILWCGTLAVSANDQDEVFAALLGNLEEVWFSPKVLFEDNHRDACFECPSSPTDCPLPAGNYVFWARRGSARGPIKQCKDVGIDGLTER